MSTKVMLRDLIDIYNGRSLSRTAPSYAEYISYCIKNPISASIDYWINYLNGVKPCHIPLLDAEPSIDRQVLTMNVECSEADTLVLRDFCADVGVTLANVFQAAWAIVLRTYTGEDDVCFGHVSSGRDLLIPHIQDIVGPFINMLVCRSNLDKERQIVDVICQMQEDHISSLTHQRCSLAAIQNKLKISKEGLFNTGLSVQKITQMSNSNLSEASVEQIGGYDPTEFDIMVNVADSPTQVGISFNYSNRISELQALHISKTFSKVLSSIVSRPSSKISNVDPLSDFDKAQINSWHEQLPDFLTTEECIHEAFRCRAELHPNAPAICSWDRNLTYAELDDLSTRLANHLVSLGVKPEAIVMLSFEKSTWAVVSILAVLKAGGSCVTLDASLPLGRVQSILLATESDIMLTSASQSNIFTGLFKHSISINEELVSSLPSPLASTYAASIWPDVRPDNMAFVVFTSGSTGTPKGVMLEHRTICFSARSHAEAEHVGPSSRYLQFSAFAFDVYISEIFVPLLCGGCVCIATEEERRTDIAGAITRFSVTHATLTPTVATFFSPKDVPTLKMLALGGEAMTRENVATWAGQGLHWFNVYGPSETSNFVCVEPVRTAQPANLGRGGIKVWLVDINNQSRLSPIGCVSELYVEGPSLARGYLNDPDKTKDSFITNPPWLDSPCGGPNDRTNKARRVYRTGDLVQYNLDGTFSYIGRKDSQVKIRGQRLEIAEVEHQLLDIVDVKHCFIDYPRSGPCSNRIVAVMTLHELSNIPDPSILKIVTSMHTGRIAKKISAIQDSLSDKLPAWMVPSIWIVVEELPLSVSLKLDRSRIKSWLKQMSDETFNTISRLSLETSVVLPTTPLEKQIQQIWCQVLNLPETKIGVQTSFLRVGGDSITAMQVIAKCRAINISLSISDILRNFTISQLAVRAQSVQSNQLNVKEEYNTAFHLSPIQQMHLSRGSAGDKFSQSIFLRVNGDVSSQNIQNALEILVERHSMLRATFSQSSSGEWTQKTRAYSPGLFLFRCSEVTDSKELGPLASETQRGLNFYNGPLFAAHLLFTSSEGTILFLVAHHLVIDSVSWRILLSNLEEYLQRGNISTPRPLPFQNWSKVQFEQAKTINPADTLPFDVPIPNYAYWGMADRSNLICDTICKTITISSATTSALVDECNRPMRTEILDLLLSAVSHSFARVFTDREVPPIYNEGHGREPGDDSIDLSQTVGWFTTIYPIAIPTRNNIVDTVKIAKDNRRKVPRNGWNYFTSCTMSPGGSKAFASHFPFEVLLNYSGSYQQLEHKESLFSQFSTEITGYVSDIPQMSRFELFGIEAVIDRGSLRLDFNYNAHMKHQSLIQEWIKEIEIVLGEMPAQMASIERQLTLTDFPLLPSMRYSDITKLTTEVLPQLDIDNIDDIEDIYPCTPIQEGMLVSQIKTPENYKVNSLSRVVPAPGQPIIDVERLQNAWQAVVNRHSILRTVFIEGLSNDGLFQQIVLKKFKADFFRLKCNKSDEALRMLQDYPSTDYTALRPSHRLGVCQVSSSSDVYFRLEISHALTDAFSTKIIERDFIQAYANALPTIPGPLYSDYISYIQAQDMNVPLEFWKNKLSGLKPCHFPVSDRSQNQQIIKKEIKDIQVPFISATSVHSFCEEHSVTPSTLFQAVWSFVLKTYTQNRSICFGYVSAGRDLPVFQIEDTVGPFINMLVSYTKFVDTDSVMSVLRNIHTNFVDSLPHQICSLASIQHELESDGTALFNTSMSIQRRSNSILDQKSESGIQIESLDGQDPNEYDVVVGIYDSDMALDVSILYNKNCLSESFATRVAHTFAKVLSSIIASPDQMVKDLDPLSDYDKSQIQSWHYPLPEVDQRCIHEAFTAQALAHPNNIAISSWDGELTYAELEDLSNRLGYYLSTFCGVKAEVIVPLCFEKSIWAVVSMLAVLKAGGACVSFDISHPFSRMHNIIQETKARVMLTGPAHCAKFADSIDTLITIDESFVCSLTACSGPISSDVKPTNLAFIVFTSGTTGKPKGIMLEHKTVYFSARCFEKVWNISSDSRFFQFSSFAFDVYITEIFGPLTCGACVCMPSEDERKNDLGATIHRLQATHLIITPTIATVLQPHEVPSVQYMGLGGEALSRENLLTWADKVNLISTYGPSETSNWVSAHVMTTAAENPTNLGRGIDTHCWIVDPENRDRLVPIGCIGELYVSGPSLSRGYINDPIKTEEAFGMCPPWAVDTEGTQSRRVYRTGDLVCYNSDGTFNHMGRGDSQLKIRGQRVELTEIEHHLLNAPDTKYSIVHVPTSGPFAGRLAAVMVLHKFADLEAPQPLRVLSSGFKEQISIAMSSIHDYIVERLPAWMVPEVWIIVEDLPLSISGKLDRSSIRNWVADMDKETFQQVSQHFVDATILPPETPEEKELQQMWSEILGVSSESIGTNSSFLRLGGDSIGAMKLVAVVRRRTSWALSVADIFRHPTLSAMAASAISATPASQVISTTENIAPYTLIDGCDDIDSLCKVAAAQCQGVEPKDIEDIYPSTTLQEGLLALSAKQPGTYVARYAFTLPAHLDIDRFRSAWDHVFRLYPILRTRFITTESFGTLQVVTNHRMVWYSSKSEISMEEYIKQDKESPMSFGAQLSRFAIVNGHFVITAHHAVYDGWSLPSLMDDVAKIYRGIALPDRPPFKNFISYIRGIKKSAAEEYWTKQLDGAKSTMFPKLPSQSYQPLGNSSIVHEIYLPPKESSNITASTVIRAAWALVVARYSDERDVTFGVTVSGRSAPVEGIADMIGTTIATVPVRVNLDEISGISVSHFLEWIQHQWFDMIPFEQVGLQEIGKLSPEARAACRFQNRLIIQPQGGNDSEFESMGIRSVDTDGENFHTYAITLDCALLSTGVKVTAVFDESVVNSQQMARILNQFESVIRELQNDNATIDNIVRISAQDRQEIDSWHEPVPPAIEECIHEAFTRQVLAQPDAPAICSWDGELTYTELDDLSTRLASELVRQGITSENVVPLCFDKSLLVIISMLAVLKAGGACMTLDTSHPVGRMKDMCREVQPRVILTSPEYSERWLSGDSEVIIVDEQYLKSLPSHVGPVCTTVQPDHLAFLIFTSGSTGKPKGVMLEHKSVRTSAHNAARLFNVGPSSRGLQFSAFAFDVYIYDIFTALMHGACVCVPSEEERRSSSGLSGAINKLQASYVYLTPTVATWFGPDDVPTIKQVAFGGEPLTQENVSVWASKVRIVNVYGPSETSNWVSYKVVHPDTKQPGNIGSGPYTNTWLVDPHNSSQLAPIGCVGEIYVESPTVSRGYFNDPVRTKESFIINPPWVEIQSGQRRMYRTGDHACYNSDGTFYFVGRTDSQLKIRGQRLELGEIQHHVVESKGIRHGFVDFPKSGPCAGKLIAVISLSEFSTASSTALRLLSAERKDRASEIISNVCDYIADRLPAWMIPTVWAVVEALPMSASGKLDRARLRSWTSEMSTEIFGLISHLFVQSLVTEPRTPTERLLQQIWGSVLEVKPENIGSNSSFLRLGGDSISAMRLVSQCHKNNLYITAYDILRGHTISELAAKLDTMENEQSLRDAYTTKASPNVFPKALIDTIQAQTRQETPAIAQISVASDFQVASFTQQILQQHGNLNYYIFDIEGPLDVKHLRSCCQLLLEKHSILRSVFVAHERRIYQAVLEGMPVNFSLLQGSKEACYSIIKEDQQIEFCLGDILTAFMLVEETPNRHSLIVRLAHAVYDGISISKVFLDLQEVYAGRAMSEYTDFSLYRQFKDSVSQESQQYWLSYLQGAKMTKFLSRPRPSYKDFTNSSVHRMITMAPLSQNGITTANIIKGAWALCLAQLSGESDVVFGELVNGRSVPVAGIDNMIGVTLSNIPVRVQLDQSMTVLDFLQKIQERQLESMPFESFGFNEIVEQCTEWPQWTQLGSIITHDNLAAPHTSFSTSDCQWNLREVNGNGNDEADIGITSTIDGDKLSISIGFCDRLLSNEFMNDVLDQLCYLIQFFANYPLDNLPDYSSPVFSERIPLPHSQGFLPKKLTAATRSDDATLTVVRQIWNSVLCDEKRTFSLEAITEDTPFYNVWGKLIAAAQFSFAYRQKGFKISMEEIIDHPTIRTQVDLCIEKSLQG
ncbi:hypothetical protein F5884DRAFT_698604 [Xylogone sp. PMI_703]|nr:hypothetical protein F5884DRAFT_698604 [Xylogone sp. PMI_703]